MHYTATSDGYRKFEVSTESNELLGKLECNMWRPTKAIITVNNTDYHITPVGFWQATMLVSRNNTPIAEIKYNLSKGIRIQFSTNANPYFFKQKGFWHTRYSVSDEYGQEAGNIETRFDWRSFRYQYDIEVHSIMLNNETSTLLPLLMLYCLRYTRMLMGG